MPPERRMWAHGEAHAGRAGEAGEAGEAGGAAGREGVKSGEGAAG